ncbi:hypothetical protein GDO86_005265, partial [Hymenochirus boettgeri]
MGFEVLLNTWKWQVFYTSYVLCLGLSRGQLHYTVVEESEPGTLIGNVARDLGFNVEQIYDRKLHLGSEESRRYFSIKMETGDLHLTEKIDRESLCGFLSSCLLPVELIIEKPLELFRLIIEILDINDNSPSFVNTERLIQIAELASPGLRFPLENAIDPDVGTNGVVSYKMSPSQYFTLSVKELKDGKLFPEIVLEHALDREDTGEHHLIITAFDGGHPLRSGTTKITVYVLDNNDNPPTFDQPVYKTSLLENIPLNSMLIKLNATDVDEGLNSEIEYSFEDHTSSTVKRLFRLDPQTGEIYVQGDIDFEESNFYEIYIRARDKGIPVMEGHCVIQVELEDSNDNAPEVLITSLESSIPENIPVGTVVGLFNIIDRDSGKNGEVMLEISSGLPFKFVSVGNHYSLITNNVLDRETTPQYIVYFIATDQGFPPMFTEKTFILNISDINDNAPLFSQPLFNAYVYENNPPGELINKVFATDEDEGTNSFLIYSVLESYVLGSPISSFIYINENNGHIYAQRSFDYEHVQHLEITIFVEDKGSPRLKSNTTIHIFVLDQNDNNPTILYPVLTRETIEFQKVPRIVSLGYLVTKVTAVDADSGYNAWLSYSILQTSDPSLFRITKHTGEIRIMRNLLESEETTYTIYVLVRDKGEPSLSSTATIIVSFENDIQDETPKSQDYQISYNEQSDMTLYLIISLAAISVVALVTFVVLAIRCLKTENESRVSNNFPSHVETSLQLNSQSTLKYMEVKTMPRSSTQSYQTSFSPALHRADFTFLKPLDFPQLKDLLNDADAAFSLDDEFDEVDQ